MFTHFSRNMCSYNVSIFKLYLESGIWKGINDGAFHFNGFFFSQNRLVSYLNIGRV